MGRTPKTPISDDTKQLIIDFVTGNLGEDITFLELCNQYPGLGTPASDLRKACQKFKDNFGRRRKLKQSDANDVRTRLERRLNSPEANRLIIPDEASSSNMSSQKYPKFSEAWARSNAEVDCFQLDPYNGSTNTSVQATIVNGIVIGNVMADKFRLQLSVEDIEDLSDAKYSARLELDGKGIFITQPRAPKFWYKDIEERYAADSLQTDPEYQAHAAQAVALDDNEELQQRIVYHKFPDGMICDNTFFNTGVGRNEDTLQLQMIGFIQRPLPDYFWKDENGVPMEGYPMYQFIMRIGWDCVIKASVTKVEGSKNNTQDDVRRMMQNLSMKGVKKFNQRSTSFVDPPLVLPPAPTSMPMPTAPAARVGLEAQGQVGPIRPLLVPSHGVENLHGKDTSQPMVETPVSTAVFKSSIRKGATLPPSGELIRNRTAERSTNKTKDIRDQMRKEGLDIRRGLVQPFVGPVQREDDENI